MAATVTLTEREQQTLEHLQKAQELGSSLNEYCAAFGLEVKKLYVMKKQLVRKGVLPPARGKVEVAKPTAQPSAFVPVRIVPSGSPPAPTNSQSRAAPLGGVLRLSLRHSGQTRAPSGQAARPCTR